MAHGIYGINAFPAFVSLTPHPMSIEIREETVDIVSPCRVAIPLCSIELEQCLIL